MKKGNLFRIITIFILIVLLINFSFVLAQTSGTGGTTGGTGSTTQSTPEDQTKAGTENPASEGNIQDKQQDLGGLAGLDEGAQDCPGGVCPVPGMDGGGSTGGNTIGGSVSSGSLKGDALHFERNWEGDSKQVEITPNQGGKTDELEINGEKQGDFAVSNGALGESKLNIEKGEKGFAETTEGTDFKTGENGGDYDLAGRKIEDLPANTDVKITDENKDGQKQVDITLDQQQQANQPYELKTPEERKNGEEEKDKETIYNWNGLTNAFFKDNSGNQYNINGDLSWSSSKGWFVDDIGKDLTKINDIGFASSGNGNNQIQIGFGDNSLAKNAEGAYAIFNGNNQFTIGSNNNAQSPNAVFFPSSNNFGANVQNGDNFQLRANANGALSLTNRDSQGFIPNMDYSGNGGLVINGNLNFRTDSSGRFDADRIGSSITANTVPVELSPKNSAGDFILQNFKTGVGDNINVDNYGRYGVVPSNHNFDRGPYNYYDNKGNTVASFDSRITNNHLPQNEQNLLNSQTPDQQQNFLDLPPPQRNSIYLQQQGGGTIDPTKPLIDPNKVGAVPKAYPGNQPSSNSPGTRIPTQPQTQTNPQQPQGTFGPLDRFVDNIKTKADWGQNFRAIDYSLNDKNFGGSYNPSKHTDGVLLKFTSPSCPGCQQMKNQKVLESVASQRQNIKIAEVDVTTKSGLSLAQQYQIGSIPSMLYLKDGRAYTLGEPGYMNVNQINEGINYVQQGKVR